MFDLGTPLGGHVLKGGGRHHREADEEHVRLQVDIFSTETQSFHTTSMRPFKKKVSCGEFLRSETHLICLSFSHSKTDISFFLFQSCEALHRGDSKYFFCFNLQFRH